MAKNEPLPGLEREKIRELSTALVQLRTYREARMDHTKKEVEAQENVLRMMHENKLDSYRDDDYDPPLYARIVKGKEKVSIKLPGNDDDGLE